MNGQPKKVMTRHNLENLFSGEWRPVEGSLRVNSLKMAKTYVVKERTQRGRRKVNILWINGQTFRAYTWREVATQAAAAGVVTL